MTIDREKRQTKVLEIIIKTHVKTAYPVGSGYISKALGLSSATIRNAMAQLEDEGYVRQPYTSAGRIPTDLGYRKYVDNITSFQSLSQDDVIAGVKRCVHNKRVFDEVIEAVSHAISEMTNYTGLALSRGNKLYFDGIYRMFELPEFREITMARRFLRILEERRELTRLMSKDLESTGTKIRIGRENKSEGLKEYTIITSTYKVHNSVSGNVGVIGPIRMRYEEVVPAIESLAQVTTEILEDLGIDE